MSELFVTPIATGDSSRNKAAVSLNNAGTSPRNPALYGLGMALYSRVVPGVTGFRVWVGLDASPRIKLLPAFTLVNSGLYRLHGRVGDEFGLNVDYRNAVRLFLDVEANSGVGEVTEAREFWVQENPLIEVIHCGACSAWCCEVAHAYTVADGVAYLSSDPGPPPIVPTVTTPSGTPTTAVTVPINNAEVLFEETVVGDVSFSVNGEYSLLEDTLVVEGVSASGYGTYLGNPVRFTLSGTFVGSGTHTDDEFSGTGSIEMTGSMIDAITGEVFSPVTCTVTGQFFHSSSEFAGQSMCLTQSGSGVAPSVIEVGPDKIVSLILRDEGSTSDQQHITFQLMRNWQDEFGQFQYGGAKYVSVFDADGDENELFDWIEPVFQKPIREFSSIAINQVDPSHEYRLIFRFRSELDDEMYVDKLVRLRLLTAEVMQYRFGDTVTLADMPDIEQTGSTFQFVPGADLGLVQAFAIVDHQLVTLPLPGSTDPEFPGAWMEHWGLVYGREVVVVFSRQYDGVSFEHVYVTYRYKDGVFTKVMLRRDVSSKSRSFTPDVRVRLVMPTLATVYGGVPGPAFLEVLHNTMAVTSAVLMTERGSLNLPLPLRPGKRFDVTELLDIDGLTGAVKNARAMLLLMTRESCRVYEVFPASFKPYVQHRLPVLEDVSGDVGIVEPETIERTASQITMAWPSATSESVSYSFETPTGASDPVLVIGQRGMVRVAATPGGTSTINVENLVDRSDPTVTLVFTVTADSESYEHVMTVPCWTGIGETTSTDGFPDSGVIGTDELGLVYFNDQVIITRRPERLISIDLTGPGGTRTLYSQELKLYEWLHIGQVSQDSSTLTVVFRQDDGAGGVVTSPDFVLPQFLALPQVLVAEFSLGSKQWAGLGAFDTVARMPKAKIDRSLKTITFDFAGRYSEWVRWSIANPLDGQQFSMSDRPLNLTPVDIPRMFRDDSARALQAGHCVVVTFLHVDGPQVTGLYRISDDFVDAIQTNVLRGRAWNAG